MLFVLYKKIKQKAHHIRVKNIRPLANFIFALDKEIKNDKLASRMKVGKSKQELFVSTALYSIVSPIY